MPVDADLLEQALAAEAALIEADHQAEVARADFHRAVRRLQLAGASLREIAAALGLSHQRVHQIVEEAGGARSWRTSRTAGDDARSCSFCGDGQQKVATLVAGPGVFICNRCMSRVHKVMAAPGRTLVTPVATIAQVSPQAAAERCSFCAKRRAEVQAMASAGAARICDECLRLCLEIRREQLDR